MLKTASTPGSRKRNSICGTASLEFCPTDESPLTLASFLDKLIANGATLENGSPVTETTTVDAINVVASDSGVRSLDCLTGDLVEPDACGIDVTNNGSTVFLEAGETFTTESPAPDFAISAPEGTACFQVDLTLSQGNPGSTDAPVTNAFPLDPAWLTNNTKFNLDDST
ncbi:MAG: hypothetical protein AAF236_11105, partial [Verrucomicrobiota bacterium]